MRISLSDGRTTLLSDKYSKERVIINVHIFSRAFARIAGFFWWTVYAASISRWPAINTSVTYLLVFVFPMRTVHTSAKSGATTKFAFTHSNKFLLPSGSCMAGLVVNRKRGTESSRLETAFLLPNRAQQPAGGPDVFAARFLPFRLCSETVFDGNPSMAVPAGLDKRVECYGTIQRV